MGVVHKAFQLFLYLEHTSYIIRNGGVYQFIPSAKLLYINFAFGKVNVGSVIPNLR